MRLAIAVGTRPEIIKMAPVIRACQDSGTPFTIIHTGQHYSYELDGVFFDELDLPKPDTRLDVGSGSHAHQIAAILERLEPVLAADRPDVLLVQGDTNSVLGVALAGRTLGIPIAHVEAGLRSGDRSMPEEMNRTVVDHIADVCFAPTTPAAANLMAEGIPTERIAVTGNTVVDEIHRQRHRAEALAMPSRFGVKDRPYLLATVHRAENTDDPLRLAGILAGLEAVVRVLGAPLFVALHPRTQAKLDAHGIHVPTDIRVLPSLGYLEFLGLQASAALVLTDSGGVQEEACSLGVPCVTLRDSTERPESIQAGANVLAGADPARILDAAQTMFGRPATWSNPFGDGTSGTRIVDWLRGTSAATPRPYVAIPVRPQGQEVEGLVVPRATLVR